MRLKNVTTQTVFLEPGLFWEPGEERDVSIEVLERNKDGLWLVEGKLIELPAPAVLEPEPVAVDPVKTAADESNTAVLVLPDASGEGDAKEE